MVADGVGFGIAADVGFGIAVASEAFVIEASGVVFAMETFAVVVGVVITGPLLTEIREWLQVRTGFGNRRTIAEDHLHSAERIVTKSTFQRYSSNSLVVPYF